MNDAPRPIAPALAAVLRGLGIPGVDALGLLRSGWTGIFGALAEQVTLIALRDGELTVAVDGPEVASELVWSQATIIANAARVSGEPVDRLSLRVRR